MAGPAQALQESGSKGCWSGGAPGVLMRRCVIGYGPKEESCILSVGLAEQGVILDVLIMRLLEVVLWE